MSFCTMDKSCIVAITLFVLSNVFGGFFIALFHGRANFDYNIMLNLDTGYIQQEWDWRNRHRALEISSGLLNALAWFFLAIPITQVAWFQSNNGTRMIGVHIMVVTLALGGAITELASHLLYLGATNMMEWLSKDFNLDTWVDGAADGSSADGVGWKTLEVVHWAIRGMLIWVGALEHLFLAAIFLLIFVSIRSQHERLFGMRWAYFGLILAAFCLIDFGAELLRFHSWRAFAKISGLITVLHRLILLPGWIFWLGKQLPQVASTKASSRGTRGDQEPTDSTDDLGDIEVNHLT